MKRLSLNFGSRSAIISGRTDDEFQRSLAAAIRVASVRGESLPPELIGLDEQDLEDFVASLPDDAGVGSNEQAFSPAAGRDRAFAESSSSVKEEGSGGNPFGTV